MRYALCAKRFAYCMDLSVQKREKFGRAVKTLRREGLIPAELYGHGVENLHLAIPKKEFTKIFKEAGESTMINIVLVSPTGEERRPAMIHDVSYDSLTDEVINVDFYQVRLDEKVKVKVPLNFTGQSPAVKDLGGVLVKAMHDIEIEALPDKIPHAIQVDITQIKNI